MQLWAPAGRRRVVLVPDVATVGGAPLWPAYDERSEAIREVVERYIQRLDPRRQDLLRSLLAGESERELAARLGVNPSTAWRVVERAVRALVREMALDDPEFRAWDRARRRGVRGSVPRDLDAEREAAARVLARALSDVHRPS